MVIDDGELSELLIGALRKNVEGAGWRFTYRSKRTRPGLYRSRLEAIACSEEDILLFFDDDVEVVEGYLPRVLETYVSMPHIAGLGGVDVLGKRAPLWRRLYEYAIGFRAFRLGQLSITSYGGGMDTWAEQHKPFQTEYLYGCNMSFRRVTLRTLGDPNLFEGHASGEDLYLSMHASKHGALYVDPALRVRHYQSPTSRDRLEQVCYRQIVNHYGLLAERGASIGIRLLLLYTAMGLVGLSIAKLAFESAFRSRTEALPRVRGGLRGLWAVVKSLTIGHSQGWQ
jgi:Glycosyl transferase family 2